MRFDGCSEKRNKCPFNTKAARARVTRRESRRSRERYFGKLEIVFQAGNSGYQCNLSDSGIAVSDIENASSASSPLVRISKTYLAALFHLILV
jgi:hypothetical protein